MQTRRVFHFIEIDDQILDLMLSNRKFPFKFQFKLGKGHDYDIFLRKWNHEIFVIVILRNLSRFKFLTESDIVPEIEDLAVRLFEEEEDLAAADASMSAQESIFETSSIADRLKKYRKSLEKSSVDLQLPAVGSTFRKSLKAEISIFQQTIQKCEILSKLFNNLLKIKPSTVDVETQLERVFSASGLILTRLRCRLADDLLDSIVFLRQYFTNQKHYDM